MSACPSCGAVVADGLWFCPACGMQVAGPQTVPMPAAPVEVSAPSEPPVRRLPGWVWAAAALGLFAVVGIVAGLLAATHHGHAEVQAGAPTIAVSDAPAPSATATPTKKSRPIYPAARVAVRVSALIAAEASAHRGFNTAVAEIQRCRDLTTDTATIAAFADTRGRLLTQLRQVHRSDSADLNALVSRLEGIWGELLPVDQQYVAWADSAAGCHRGATPSSTAAQRQQRTDFSADWRRLLEAHPAWGVSAVVPDALLL